MKSTLVVSSFGTKEWKNKKGLFHRDDGPAIIHPNGTEEWYRNGKIHRRDGPAVVRPYEKQFGTKYEWWYNGKRITSNSFGKLAYTKPPEKIKEAMEIFYNWARIANVNEEELTLIKLKYNVPMAKECITFNEWTKKVEKN